MWMRLHQYKEKRGTRAELYRVYQEEGKEKNSLKDMQKVIRNVESQEGEVSQQQGEDEAANEEQLAFSKLK